MSEEKGSEGIVSSSKILLYPFNRGICKVYDTDFSSFPTDAELLRVEIDVIPIQCGQFRYTQSGRINTLDNRSVAFALDRFGIDDREQSVNFFAAQKCHFAVALFDEVNRCRVDGFESLLATKFQK